MLKPVYTFLLLLLFVSGIHRNPVQADDDPFRIMLFSGGIFLVNHQGERIPAAIGLAIRPERFKEIELATGSRLYLQRGERLLRLERPGTIAVAEIVKEPGSLLSDTLQFLAKLTRPRSFTRQVRARGAQIDPDTSDSALFRRIWEEIALDDVSAAAAVPPEDALAAAAWFHQQDQPARTAYILEYLDNTTQPRNPFYQTLRNDSLRGVPLADINATVEETRRAATQQQQDFRYQALLIGINKYDHPAWQPLDNPVADIRSIRNLLVESYRFSPGDITILENPTFSEMINAFQELKTTVDNRTRLIIYYAGHGYYPEDEDEGYWIPRNGGDPATQRFFIPTSIILSKMKAIRSRHTLLITDSCFSGSLIRKSRGAVIGSGFYRDLSSKKSRQIITSGGLEPVSDSGSGNHSVFAGNLLQILSKERETPLSASELAIEIRKSLKNAGARQTPEYGRLYAAGDENGEFFFVRREQSLRFADSRPAAPPPSLQDPERNGLDLIGMSNPPDNDGSAFQAVGEEPWIGVGLFYHIGFLNYNHTIPSGADAGKAVRISTSLEGSGLQLTYRRTQGKSGYGAIFNLGQFSRIKSCANTDSSLSDVGFRTCKEEEDRESVDHSTLSGYFTHLGVFADYSMAVYKRLSVQLGGAVKHRYYVLDHILEAERLNSSTLAACGKGGLAFRNLNWATRIYMDFCASTFEFGGSLHELNEDDARDVRLLGSVNVGLETLFLF